MLLARGRDGLEAAKREVEQRGGQALAVPTDVSNFDQVKAAADAAQRAFGPVDLWINNAMVSMYSPFDKMTPDEFRHIVEVTFLGNVYGTKCGLEQMWPRRSRRDPPGGLGTGLPLDSLAKRLLREQARD